MKILTDDHWELIIGHQEWLKARVKELEGQNLALMDRLLIQQGQMPLDLKLGDRIEENEKAHNDLMETLTCETIGSDPDGEDNER